MINKIFSWLFTGSRVSFFRKKTLIVNFKKDLTKTLKVIDLTKYENYHFEIEKEEEIERFKNNYKLVLVENSGIEHKITLSYFESQADAQRAMLDLNNKMYDRFLTVLYTLFKVAVLAFILLFIVDTIMLKARSLHSPASQAIQVDPAVLEQIRQQRQAQSVPVEPEAPAVINEPGSSGAKNILDSLK